MGKNKHVKMRSVISDASVGCSEKHRGDNRNSPGQLKKTRRILRQEETV